MQVDVPGKPRRSRGPGVDDRPKNPEHRSYDFLARPPSGTQNIWQQPPVLTDLITHSGGISWSLAPKRCLFTVAVCHRGPSKGPQGILDKQENLLYRGLEDRCPHCSPPAGKSCHGPFEGTRTLTPGSGKLDVLTPGPFKGHIRPQGRPDPRLIMRIRRTKKSEKPKPKNQQVRKTKAEQPTSQKNQNRKTKKQKRGGPGT